MNWQTRRALASDAPSLAKIHVEVWQESYRGILPQADLDRLNVNERCDAWQKQLDPNIKHPFFTWVVEGNHELLGFATGGPNRAFHPAFKNWFDHADPMLARYQGELNAIYIRKNHQRQGIGRALFNAVSQECKNLRLKGLLCWVLPENTSRHFYERLGGKIAGKGSADISGPREMWAYVWET